MIINDDLGAFMKVPVGMGNRAARLIDQLFFSRLLKNPVQLDGKALFSAAHKNILNGASSALSAESLKKAIQLFLDQVDADNQPISVEPAHPAGSDRTQASGHRADAGRDADHGRRAGQYPGGRR